MAMPIYVPWYRSLGMGGLLAQVLTLVLFTASSKEQIHAGPKSGPVNINKKLELLESLLTLLQVCCYQDLFVQCISL